MNAVPDRLSKFAPSLLRTTVLPVSRSDHATCHNTVLNDTRRWLERAVIGLNLCPFAKAVYVKGPGASAGESGPSMPADLLQDLIAELQALDAADPQARDTTY